MLKNKKKEYEKYNKCEKKYKISFCITCKNRSNHLKKTILRNIKDNQSYPFVEFVILDYNSEDDLEKWVFKNLREYLKNNKVVYYQTKIPKYFHMSKAKNIAHRVASGDIVCNLDADNFTGKNFANYINYIANKNNKIIGHFGNYENIIFLSKFGSGGRIFLFKKDFLELGGYDESFEGWGHENNDLKRRAGDYGLNFFGIPINFSETIIHSYKKRCENYKKSICKNINEFNKINLEKYYENIKNKIIKLKLSKLPSDLKRIYPK